MPRGRACRCGRLRASPTTWRRPGRSNGTRSARSSSTSAAARVTPPTGASTGSMYAPHLLGVRAAAIVKQSVPDVPVFAVHRILTPDEAEGILERGEADAVTLVRALIADPEWANKARAGHTAEIRACTGCNQGCY